MAAWPGWRPGTWHTNTVDRVNVSAVGLLPDSDSELLQPRSTDPTPQRTSRQLCSLCVPDSLRQCESRGTLESTLLL
jgi:hypothetical protein